MKRDALPEHRQDGAGFGRCVFLEAIPARKPPVSHDKFIERQRTFHARRHQRIVRIQQAADFHFVHRAPTSTLGLLHPLGDNRPAPHPTEHDIISDPDSTRCPFCNLPPERIIFGDDIVFALWDGYPVSPGHALLIPKRHVATWFEATPQEQAALMSTLDRAKALIEKDYHPDGYNIGINSGAAAGQTVFHLHVHLIPRYVGDVPDPRGGVRHVIPDKVNYTANPAIPSTTNNGPAK